MEFSHPTVNPIPFKYLSGVKRLFYSLFTGLLFTLFAIPLAAAPFSLSFNVTDFNGYGVSCNGAADGAIDMTVTGGTLPFTFEWSNGATTEDIASLVSGIYIVTVVDADLDTVRDTITITEPAVLGLLFNTVTSVLCNGNATGSIDISITGGVLPYDFLWSNAATTEDLSSLTAGLYTVTVTDLNNCLVTDDTTLTEPPPLLVNISHTNANAAPDGTAMSAPTGGVSPYAYLWSTGATTSSISGLLPATYTVTVTDANLCNAVDSAQVLNALGPCTIALDSLKNVTCYGLGNGAVYISVTAGINPITYSWSNGATTQDITALAPGVYTVTATDVISCMAVDSFTVTQPDTIDITLTPSSSTCGNPNGSITGAASGGTGVLTYLWSNSATTVSISGIAAGTYTITVTDASGCTNSDQATVTNVPGPGGVVDSVKSVSCFGGNNGAIYITPTGGTAPLTYLWSNGATTQDATGFSAGTYTVTITDFNSCTFSISDIVTQPALLNDSVRVTNSKCGLSNGSIIVFPFGGTSPYTFNWNTGATSQSISGLSAGNYTVVITDARLCTKVQNATVVNQPGPAVVVDSVKSVACFGQNNGAVYITASGGTAPLTYLWSNLATTSDLLNVIAGTYTVTVTDANLCTATVSGIVTQPVALNDSVQSVNSKCGLPNGSVTVYPYNGTSPYTYSWNTGATTQTVSGLAAGTYTVTITDSKSCTRTRTRTITNVPGPGVVLDSVKSVSCFGGANGAVYITPSGGTAPLTYLWNSGGTTQDVTNIAAGTYTVTVTDANLCTASVSGVVGQPVALNDSVKVNHTTCGLANGSITIYPYSGTGPYTYLWNTGSTAQTISALSAGNYTVTIQDANSCTRSRTATVNASTSPAVVVDSTRNARCNGQASGGVFISITGGTSPFTYLWSNGATTQDINNILSGTYTVTVTDNLGCTATASRTITQPTALNGTLAITNASCNQSNGAVTITMSGGTPGYTYLWSNGQTTQTMSNVSAGTYSVTVTDANSCSYQRSAIVGTVGIPVVSFDSLSNVRCFGQANGAIYVSLSGGTSPYSYLWSNAATTQDLTGLIAGTYTLTVTDFNGCQVNFDTTVTQPAALNETVSTTASTCFLPNGAATVNPNGGTAPYTFLWSSGQTTGTISGVLSGTYTVTITDFKGCTKQRSVNISNNGGVTIVTDSILAVKCFGAATGGIYISITSGQTPFVYSWNNGATTQDVTTLTAGNYTVTVTDFASCTAQRSFTVTQPAAALNDSVKFKNASCGLNNGFVTVYPYGGTSPYTYLWSTGATLQSITGLSAGVYTVTVTDANGCTKNRSRILTSQPGPVIVVDSVKNATCNGFADGGIYISITSGTSPFTYSWNTGQTTQDISGLAAGTYTVTATDFNGCTAIKDTTITQPADINAAAQVTNTTCGLANGNITINPTGGTAPYTYLWHTGQTTQTISSIIAGVYTITVTDKNGCTKLRTVTVNDTPGPNAVIDSVRNVSCFGGNNGAIYISVTGGTSPITYLWSNGATIQDVTGLSAGSYTVTVSDGNSCTVQLSSNITQSVVLNDSLTVTNANCGAPTGIVTVHAYGGTSPYTYLWSGGQTSSTIFSLPSGSYTVTITDAKGCTKTDVANVSNNGAPVVILDSIKNVKCFGGSDGGIFISVTGGTNPYSYLWSTSATTQDLTNIAAGSYTVTITDANSCVSILSGIVNQPAQLLDSVKVVQPVCSLPNGQVTIYPYGGTSPYSYFWNNAQTTQTINGLGAGNYTVTITDANSCTRVRSVTLINQAGPVVVLDSVKNALCFGQANGAVYISVSGGTAPISYLWTGGATTQDLTNVVAGTYTVTVTDGNGCTTVTSGTVNQPTALNDSTQTVPESCGNMNGSATVFAFGGTPNYTYLWNTGSTSTTITALASGNYTVTVTDAKGCAKTTIVNVGASGSPVITLDSIVDVKCFGGTTGAVYINVSGGTTPYTYAWSSGATTMDLTGVIAGVYTVIVRDAFLCPDTVSFTVNQNSQLNDSTKTVSTTCGLANGSATVYPFGGTSPYTYQWSGGQFAQSITNQNPGTYTVTITDANLCTRTTTVTIQAIAPPVVVTDSIVDVLCNGDFSGGIYVSVQNGTPSFSYLWSNFDVTQDVTNLPAGNYTVTVTDGNSCTAVQSFTVNQSPAISDSVQVLNATCGAANGEATIFAFGGNGGPFSYVWNTGQTTQNITGLASGFYSVTITDAAGCTAIESISISNLNGPQAIVDSIIAVSCHGGSDGAIYISTINGTGPFTYLWSNNATTEDITGLIAGSYSVTITDFNNCLFLNSYNVTEPPLLDDSTQTVPATCGLANGSATVFPFGGVAPYDYLWNNGSTTQQVTGLLSGTYTVTITDNNSCTTQEIFNIINLPGPQLSLDSVQNVSCFGDSTGIIYLTVTGGTQPLDYLWSSGQTLEDIANLIAGTYTVTVTDDNGCTGTLSTPVTESTQISASFVVDQATCNVANGNIAATVSGGVPGYSYLWSNGETTGTITGLAAGPYTLTVTDQLGCTREFNTNVSNIAAPEIAVVDSGNVTCFGLTNGFILVNVSSGTPPYNLSWTNTTQTGTFISGLAGNTSYTLTVTDSIGCITVRTVFISQPAPLGISANIPKLNGNYNISCFGGNDGSIDLTVTGGSVPYTYLWSTLQVTDSIGSLPAGTYSVTVTDSKNCTGTGSYMLTEPPQLISTAGVNNVICGVNSDTLDANVPTYGTGSWSVLTGSGNFFNAFDPKTVVTGLMQGVNVFQWIVTDGVCSTVSQVAITFNNQTQALPGTDRSICADSVILVATQPQFGYGYWINYNSSGSILDSTSAITLVTGLNPGANLFQWNVVNGTCFDSAFVNIFLKDPADCIDKVEIPTGITPNGDGRNDRFEIRGIEAYEKTTLIVYNRWGSKVYEKNHYANDWEGTNQSGDPLPEGTYFYIFKVQEIDKIFTNYIDIRR